MLSTSSHDLPKKSLQIKEDDKFFSKLLSKEKSLTNSNSFRVYYGVASGAVPFMWESQPGTPKNTFSDTSLPPLTPPPSYYLNSKKKPTKKSSKSNLLDTIFPRLSLRKTHVSPSLSSASSSSISSFSSSVMSTTSSSAPPTPSNFNKRTRFSSPRSSFDSRGDDTEDSGLIGSPTSILRFSNGESTTGCYSMVIMKKALLSIVGHGSGGQGSSTTTA
ncbi:hypothetical protein BVC80_9017g13 [Macleaya cordata]|uniref:Uncharacterized protein n=1 Tax=Macleaya cordata TaxID=56857 RepID=A0A200QQD0_MACCD|nr:hypothetical protein BVC80_9017g13 [Macleaya cordata]